MPYNFISEKVYLPIFNGDTVECYKLSCVNFYQYYLFAQNIGLIYTYKNIFISPGYGVSRDSLFAYRMQNDFVNNFFTVSINNLWPLNDRPLNAFPFYINVDYSIQIPSLRDSFYVEIWHMRKNNILGYYRNNFVNNKAQVPIQPSWLQEGDIIKIRAKLSEKSIFQNADYFPDKGFAYIKVLSPVSTEYDENVSLTYSLEQNYPNPFNPSTTISWQSPVGSHQTLKVYDSLGREVATLVDEFKPAGRYEVEFNASGLSSGVYFYSLESGSARIVKKLTLLR